MTKEIKTWTDILQDIENTTNPKNVLLGNGFSMCWDYERFRQISLKPDYLFKMNEDNVEQCIEKLGHFEFPEDNTCYSIIKKIIHDKIHYDFMCKFFKKLPHKITHNQIDLYVKFLALFDNYYTLNYDPLLYLICNKYNKKEAEKFNNDNKVKIKNNTLEVKKLHNDEIKEKLTPVIQKVLNANWSIEYEGEKLLQEEINDQSHTFIKNKLISILEKNNDTSVIFKQIQTKNGYIKKEFKTWFNNEIEISQDTKIKNEDKILSIKDGFLKDKKNENLLTWSKNNPINYYHLHGAFHIIKEIDEHIIKIKSTGKTSMMEEIKDLLDNGNIPTSVLKGSYSDKLDEIKNNSYLDYCYKSLCGINGTLLTLGVSFANNDQHIVDAIVNNDNLERIYVGLWNDDTISDQIKNGKKKFAKVLDRTTFYTYNDTFVTNSKEVKNDNVNE